MAMEMMENSTGNDESLKPMNQMDDGEVCYYVADSRYVLKVCNVGQEDIYLILEAGDYNSYSHDCDGSVRELYPGESITIKFS